MRFSVATPLLALSVATPLLALSVDLKAASNIDYQLTKRNGNPTIILGCNSVFILCAAACQRIAATHVRQACNSHCYYTWLRQLREADNDLPSGIDAPVITRRADPSALAGCNNNVNSCVSTVNNDFMDPTSADPSNWDSGVAICAAGYDSCIKSAGYSLGNSCGEP